MYVCGGDNKTVKGYNINVMGLMVAWLRSHHKGEQGSDILVTRSGVPGLSLCLKEHPEELDVVMNVKIGDLLAHHCNTIHRAGKNNSKDRRRRAVGVVFIPRSCHQSPRLTEYHTTRLKEDIEFQHIDKNVKCIDMVRN